MMNDETFMKEAIRLSQLVVSHRNGPSGAVPVKDGKIIFSDESQVYTGSDPAFHAEVGLLRRFCIETHITDLHEYTLHSSYEPYFMCCGVMVQTKLGRLVYSASGIDLCSISHEKGAECCKVVFEHSPWKPQVTSGALRDESLKILMTYFSRNTEG